jgi:outer membrane biosynthesis protein TonB
MAKKTDIIKILQKATKIEEQGSDESRQDYLERLASAASDELDGEAWEALPNAAQVWVNAAVKALNAGNEITDPEPSSEEESDDEQQAEEADEEAGDDQPEDEEQEDDMPTKTAAKKKAPAKKKAAPKKTAAAKPAKTEAKPAKAKSNGAVRGTGAQTVIKQIMLKDPAISTEDLIARLEKKGLKPTKVAVTSIRSGMRHTLKVMADAGVLHSSIKLGKEA